LSFLWHAEQLIFATMADSPTTGNTRTQQRVRVALGGLRDVVRIDGNADHAPIATLTDVEAEAYIHKHDGDPRRWADTVIRVVPDRIQAWYSNLSYPLVGSPVANTVTLRDPRGGVRAVGALRDTGLGSEL
jgi:hypothetical protein